MNIRLLDENTYELLNDAGEQVQQGPVLDEWKQEARSLKKARVDVVAAKLGASVATTVERTADVRPRAGSHPHEHPEYLSALPEHDHDDRYAPAVHEHPHEHPEINLLRMGIEEESRTRYKADQEQEARYKNHLHPELAQAFHTHEDIYASLNILRGMVSAVEGLIPKETQPHVHNDLVESINLLRSEMHGLRAEVNSLSSRLDAEDDALRALIESRISEVQPKGDYATRDELPVAIGLPNMIRLKEKSSQEVSGGKVTTFEVMK